MFVISQHTLLLDVDFSSIVALVHLECSKQERNQAINTALYINYSFVRVTAYSR